MKWLLVLIIVIGAFLAFLFFKKRKGLLKMKEGVGLSLFLIALPRDPKEDESTTIEDYIGKAEQFFNSLYGFKRAFFAFEISVHRTSEEICFYAACPRKSSESFTKQILSFWPEAEVSPANDYNIFNPEGESLLSEGFLSKPPLLPIRDYKEFKSDPISNLTNVLTKLKKEGEGASIQILFRPSRKNLKKQSNKVTDLIMKGKKVEGALAESKKMIIREFFDILFFGPSKKEDEGKKEIDPFEQKALSLISEKASKPLFEVNLRLVSSANNKERAENILSQAESSFEQFNSPGLNGIKIKRASRKRLKKAFYHYIFRLMGRKKMLLSSSELAGIFHFPSMDIITPNVMRIKARQAPPPPNLPEEGVVVGKSAFRGVESIVKMKEEDRRRHFYIVGQTGTGKSALLKEMIRQDISSGKGLAVIDPHGDLAEDVLGLVPKERAEDVIYFDPTDPERAMGLNMLEYDVSNPESKTFVVNEIIEIFEKLYNMKAHGFGGPMFEQYMRNALFLVMDDPDSGNTLIEVPRVLSDVNFRKYKLSKCRNAVVKNFWEFEAEKAGGEASLANMVPYITSKMNVFIANDLVRPIISQQKSSFDLKKIMNEKKILIVNLSKGKLGDINSHLLGMIFVGKILMAALSRTTMAEEERKDFYLYIDEFQNVTTKTMASILAEARKYRLNMIFAHQYIGQVEEEIQKAVFGNIGSMLSFRIGPEDAKFLVSEFEPVFTENDLANFDNHNGALRLLIDGMVTRPFNIKTLPPQKGNPEIRKLIKKLSIAKYGRDRVIVEADLYERLKKGYYKKQ